MYMHFFPLDSTMAPLFVCLTIANPILAKWDCAVEFAKKKRVLGELGLCHIKFQHSLGIELHLHLWTYQLNEILVFFENIVLNLKYNGVNDAIFVLFYFLENCKCSFGLKSKKNLVIFYSTHEKKEMQMKKGRSWWDFDSIILKKKGKCVIHQTHFNE